MNILDLDIETYSTVDLPKANVYAYVEDPAFEVMMCAWSLNGSPIEVVEGEDKIDMIPGLWDSEVKKVAHGAQFERICFSRMRGLPVGEYLPPEDWFDTMAVAREYGYPASLANLATALGADPKDTAGTRLINLFCKPNRGKRVMSHQKPEQWQQFVEYCRQDVATLQDVRRLLPGWPSAFERDLWYVDQRINDRGIRVDLPLARKAVQAANENAEVTRREMIEITGVENPGSVQQLSGWLAENGCPLPDMQAETVTRALRVAQPPEVTRVLELRQELALVASNKFEAALRGVSIDGRLRGQFVFHGAHTGRWSSKGVQVHNLAKKSFVDKNDETDWAMINACITDLLYDFGAHPETLKKLVRPMFFIDGTICDLSAIEARVLAWLAGEQWVLDAFLANRDLYVETANRMGGGMGRPEGKIAVLALGYQGAVGSIRNMGYGGREGDANYKTDAEIKRIVLKWRRTNPNIVKFWERLERAFRTGGTVGKITVEVDGSTRRIRLPSGRALHYHKVATGQRLTYQHARGYREDTYGGRLTENVTQAVARDILADILIRLDAAGYPIVSHVHDEADVESTDLEGIKAIMETGPAWAKGLPLAASAMLAERYTK